MTDTKKAKAAKASANAKSKDDPGYWDHQFSDKRRRAAAIEHLTDKHPDEVKAALGGK